MVSKEKSAKQERVKSGIEDILKFRGFVISKTDDNDENIDIYAEKKSDGSIIKAIARYPKNSQIGVKTIRTLGKHQQEKKIEESLLIAESPLTHYAKKESLKLGIEIISSANPLFNIFDHNIVPQHIKLKTKETNKILDKYQIKKHQFPKILETDPAVKAVQAIPGDVIQIIRNPSMGEAGIYYRFVIKSISRLILADSTAATKAKSKTAATKAKSKTAATKAKSKTATTKAKSKTATTKAKSKTATTKAEPKTTATKTKPKTTATKAKSKTATTKAEPKTTATKTKPKTTATKAKSKTATTKAKPKTTATKTKPKTKKK